MFMNLLILQKKKNPTTTKRLFSGICTFLLAYRQMPLNCVTISDICNCRKKITIIIYVTFAIVVKE